MMGNAVSLWTGRQSCPKSNVVTSSNMHALSWARREITWGVEELSAQRAWSLFLLSSQVEMQSRKQTFPLVPSTV